MMMMADGLLGPCSDQVIEGVTVKVESDPETEDDAIKAPLSNGYPATMTSDHPGASQSHHHHDHAQQEVVETVTVSHLFSSLSAACANCSISFFDPIGNPVYQPIFYMCLDSNTNEAIQISSVIHIIFAKKLSRCPKPSSDLALCSKCAELIARMYQLYRELDGLSTVNAYINSFLGDTNLPEVYLPTPESSNTSINYAHYEDSISAAISGVSSFSALPDMSMSSNNEQESSYDRSSSSVTSLGQQRVLTSSEPPPLTYPSYFGTPRSNPFTAQQYTNNEHFDLPDVSPLYAPHGHTKVEEVSNISYANLATASQQEPPEPPKSAAKKRRRKPGNKQRRMTEGNEGTPVTAPVRPLSERIIECPEAGCDKIYHGRGARASLRTHIQIFHLKQFPFVCQVCLKPMKKRSLLELHIKTHLGTEERAAVAAGTPLPTPAGLPASLPSNACPECGKVYTTPYMLSVHVNRHHTPEGAAKFFQCEYRGCPKKFRDKSSLRRHEIRHECPEFSCSRCPQHFPNRKLLKVHQETCALDERQFLCRGDNCKRKFKYKHHLQNHYMFQHKLTAEEARREVYPGLSVKEWMTTPRKRSPMAPNGRTPPNATSTSSDQLPPFNTVLGVSSTNEHQSTNEQSPFTAGGHDRQYPESFDYGRIPPELSSSNQNPESSSSNQKPGYSYHHQTPPYHQSFEIGGGNSKETVTSGQGVGYAFPGGHHSPPEGQSSSVQMESFEDLMSSPPSSLLTSVIQETSSALHHHNSFPNSSNSSVIHANPSVIQQNPSTLYHQNNRPPSSTPPPLSNEFHGDLSGTTNVNEVKMDLDLNE